MLICLHIIYGCFYATRAQLSSCKKDCPTKPKIYTFWPFTEKVCQPLIQENTGSKRMLHSEQSSPATPTSLCGNKCLLQEISLHSANSTSPALPQSQSHLQKAPSSDGSITIWPKSGIQRKHSHRMDTDSAALWVVLRRKQSVIMLNLESYNLSFTNSCYHSFPNPNDYIAQASSLCNFIQLQ